jgi:hypothetical protein
MISREDRRNLVAVANKVGNVTAGEAGIGRATALAMERDVLMRAAALWPRKRWVREQPGPAGALGWHTPRDGSSSPSQPGVSDSGQRFGG